MPCVVLSFEWSFVCSLRPYWTLFWNANGSSPCPVLLDVPPTRISTSLPTLLLLLPPPAKPTVSKSNPKYPYPQANGPLTEQNVFDYFATSMFYDKQSNNQVLRMQTIYTGVPIANEAEELRRFTGIEFAVVHAQPPAFFIIHKRERISPDEVKPLAAYFINNNRIYQAPDLYSLLSNRLLTSVSALQTTLDVLRKKRPDYTPRTGFVWPIVGEPEDDAKKKAGEKGGKGGGTGTAKKELVPSLNPTADKAGGGRLSDMAGGVGGPEGDDGGDGGVDGDPTEPATSQVPGGGGSGGGIGKEGTQGTQSAPTPGSTTQKRQNTILLMNAMRTTAVHSKIGLPAGIDTRLAAAESSATGVGGANEGAPASAGGGGDSGGATPATSALRSSATPAPSGQEAAIKGVNPNAEGTKKKKKKRLSIAPTPAAS
ncbi:hypothetical protein CC1G_04391 [Coprinopsis cinerea okayama7|uniref:Mediator of RNA polymerase II transcription subunit 6 n=1 Tax=Coprinopsis cinerea (strain Okayama-7 / 130 / ATCC MYA-4618 / FGSC 9003) TaxID=240176 RepID=A8N0H0_COPC7|nr:hypothetical protein CC1G_04391 [Coprinopsis cinerea okayama7\|eukprot:XP_001828420.2 hypothetical protein CC1G_04391 [Coprinopsis cinerea okayama7\